MTVYEFIKAEINNAENARELLKNLVRCKVCDYSSIYDVHNYFLCIERSMSYILYSIDENSSIDDAVKKAEKIVELLEATKKDKDAVLDESKLLNGFIIAAKNGKLE